jgi:hypothetical protein
MELEGGTDRQTREYTRERGGGGGGRVGAGADVPHDEHVGDEENRYDYGVDFTCTVPRY